MQTFSPCDNWKQKHCHCLHRQFTVHAWKRIWLLVTTTPDTPTLVWKIIARFAGTLMNWLKQEMLQLMSDQYVPRISRMAWWKWHIHRKLHGKKYKLRIEYIPQYWIWLEKAKHQRKRRERVISPRSNDYTICTEQDKLKSRRTDWLQFNTTMRRGIPMTPYLYLHHFSQV